MTLVDLAEAAAALAFRRWLEDRSALLCGCPAAATPHVRGSPCTFHRVAPAITARVASGARGTMSAPAKAVLPRVRRHVRGGDPY